MHNNNYIYLLNICYVVYYKHIRFSNATLFFLMRISKINICLNHIIFSLISPCYKVYKKSTIQQSSRILEIGCILAVFHISIWNYVNINIRDHGTAFKYLIILVLCFSSFRVHFWSFAFDIRLLHMALQRKAT